MIEYDDVTDCPTCPQLATDRDDALGEVAALEAANAELLAALREAHDNVIEYSSYVPWDTTDVVARHRGVIARHEGSGE